MISYYGIDYRSASGDMETLTIYAYGNDDGAGIAYCSTDPTMPTTGLDHIARHLGTADRQDIADAYASRMADVIVSLMPGAVLTVRQGDDIPV